MQNILVLQHHQENSARHYSSLAHRGSVFILDGEARVYTSESPTSLQQLNGEGLVKIKMKQNSAITRSGINAAFHEERLGCPSETMRTR